MKLETARMHFWVTFSLPLPYSLLKLPITQILRHGSITKFTVGVRLLLRDGPLEKLWGGGGEFSTRRNFFSLSNSLYEFILGHSMNIF